VSENLPFVSCLCSTYRHPKLLRNAVACFLAQDYPADRRELIILDDYGQYTNRSYPGGYHVVSIKRRFGSLAEKRNACAALALRPETKPTDVLCGWDDDDIYLPHHISAHVKAMTTVKPSLAMMYKDDQKYSHPSTILSLYGRKLHTEQGRGRFEGSFAFTRAALEGSGGWPITRKAEHDQTFIGQLTESCGMVVDPCEHGPPSYVYRWETTGTEHCSGYAPRGLSWYDDYAREARFDDAFCDPIVLPQFDDETKKIYDTGGRL
jgi:hypothetical protein